MSVIPAASSLILKALNEPERDRKKVNIEYANDVYIVSRGLHRKVGVLAGVAKGSAASHF